MKIVLDMPNTFISNFSLSPPLSSCLSSHAHMSSFLMRDALYLAHYFNSILLWRGVGEERKKMRHSHTHTYIHMHTHTRSTSSKHSYTGLEKDHQFVIFVQTVQNKKKRKINKIVFVLVFCRWFQYTAQCSKSCD